MDRPAAPGNFQVPNSTSTIPEGKQVVNTEEEYKQTNFYAPAQRRSMDQSRPRRSLSNGELENLDQPIYPVRCLTRQHRSSQLCRIPLHAVPESQAHPGCFWYFVDQGKHHLSKRFSRHPRMGAMFILNIIQDYCCMLSCFIDDKSQPDLMP